MTMQKLYKRFAEWVTRWKTNNMKDGFLLARLRLTFYYSISVMVIIGGSSLILYSVILSNFAQSIWKERIDPSVSQLIIDRTQDILLNRFLMIDIVIIIIAVILGFFLTRKTLAPIKSNMEKQKRFIADAAHELRTPIAVIISGLEVNLENKKLDFSSAKKTLEDTLIEMKEFSKLSNDLLNLSKYDTPTQTKHEKVAIGVLLKSTVEKNKSLATLKNIIIEADIEQEATISGNKIELARVFYNILDNAIKYSLHNGLIKVFGKIDSDKYTIIISDNGIGISKDIINRIFDPFFRGDVSRSTNGAGLGLTLSKKIIENHEGTIYIKSQKNKGTDITISFPLTSRQFH